MREHLTGRNLRQYDELSKREQDEVRMYYDVLRSETKLSQQDRAARSMQVFMIKTEKAKK